MLGVAAFPSLLYTVFCFSLPESPRWLISRKGDRGYSVDSHFCPVCGSTVYWEREKPADWIGVSVGAFADPAFPKPRRAVWTQNKHHWVVLPDDIAPRPSLFTVTTM